MKKLYENFAVTLILMFIVALADYIVIPLGGHELAVGLVLVWAYFGGWILLKRK